MVYELKERKSEDSTKVGSRSKLMDRRVSDNVG